MDPATKDRAREKKEKMGEYIAYPDEILDREVIDGFFKDLDVKEGDLYGNTVRVSKWRRR